MITILLPISRGEYLKPVFDCLNTLERPSNTELLIITDGNDELQKAVDKRLDSINYKRIQVINFGDKPAENINDRRFRISAIHNKAKHYIPENCEYVFTIEDDTVYPPNTLTKILKEFKDSDYTGMVSGVELGRHKTKYIGGWIVDNILDPMKIESIMPKDTDEPSVVQASGLYCALIDAGLYKQHNFAPFDKDGKNGLSCDVNFGLWICRKGYFVLFDWSIQCDHIGEKGSVNLGNTKPVQVVFEKHINRWSSRVVVE